MALQKKNIKILWNKLFKLYTKHVNLKMKLFFIKFWYNKVLM